MKKPVSGQMVLLGLVLFAIGVVAVDIRSAGDLESRWAAHLLTGGTFASLPFVAAAVMLTLALVKRLAVARRATTAMFAAFMVMSLLWWGLIASRLVGAEPSEVALVRLFRFILMPVLYVAALYVPSVTRYLGRSSEAQPRVTQEVSQ